VAALKPIYLDVPFAEKDLAKRAGAQWDPMAKRWFAPAGTKNFIRLGRWFRERLRLDLIPDSAWFSNLRTELEPAEWDHIRKTVYRQAGHRCQICGGKGSTHPVEAHERWLFDEQREIQLLSRIVALCPLCHLCSHFGLARVSDREVEARAWIRKINGWDEAKLEAHLVDSFAAWKRRSRIRWALDARFLYDFPGLVLSGKTRSVIEQHAVGAIARIASTPKNFQDRQDLEAWVRQMYAED
jgi:hypothetical protein